MEKASVVREIKELKTQLSYSKNVGFFFGAGTSCALGVPNIQQLTQDVKKQLQGTYTVNFDLIVSDLAGIIKDRDVNIEDILNHIRRIREITGESSKAYEGVSGDAALKLDREVCTIIYKVISTSEVSVSVETTKKFFAWLSLLNRDFSKEIFTTNYDLIIEKALEASHIPYFDGFVGSYEPFFWQESIDQFVGKDDLTQNWIRLWKIHGSLNWFWKRDDVSKANRIIRIGKIEDIDCVQNELVIYPSKEKYDSSRKQPFIAYFDRLKNYLLNGELLFVFTGYSFSDQHINEILLNCLRQNNRLTAIIFFFCDSEVEHLYNIIAAYMNLTVFGPTKAIVNGNLCEWQFNIGDLKPNEKFDSYWNETDERLKLGDFNSLVDFLLANSGKKDAIESNVK